MSNRMRERFYIAIPYALLIALALLGIALSAWEATGAVAVWMTARWLVRVGIVAGAVWALRTHRSDPRPLWVYAWLGFATYEIVATLLTASPWLGDRSGPGAALGMVAMVVSSFLFLFSFAPVVLVSIWTALRSRERSAYTVFPHAAATLPLFLLAGVMPFYSDLSTIMLISLLPLVACAALAMIYEDIPHKWRWWELYGSVVACQALLFVNPATWDEFPPFILPLLAILGLFVLTVPLILLPIYLGFVHVVSALGLVKWIPATWLPVDKAPLATSARSIQNEFRTESHIDLSGGEPMSEANQGASDVAVPALAPEPKPENPKKSTSVPSGPTRLDRMYKSAVVVLTVLIVLAVGLVIARATVYKVHEYERGLHLRGGKFLGVQKPGWHMQIPLVDTVIIVKTNERLGYVEQIPAMTSDNVSMDVSLQYTYKVHDPEQYALQVDDPERIVFEFVQGKLRDVVNTKEMGDIMNNRALMNQEVMEALIAKEEQYGVQFVTVQMQSASPPEEVVQAIRDRMVALQRQEQAQAEAAQRQTQADAELYASEKVSDAEAYQISTTAAAEAESIRLTSAAEKEAVNALLAELEDKGEIGQKFIDLLIAKELKENSKWVIGGEGTPILDLR